MANSNITKFYKSFSGTDTLAFILMPGCTPVVIGSLTTISYSVFRNKRPVINIGRTNINGVTRGSRIFAGTMIFTLINQHWLRELQEQTPYIKNYPEMQVDELPLFDIMIISANEYGNAVSMYIFGVDFTDEAQTISVEDLFTENTFRFIARDISTFSEIKINQFASKGSSTTIQTVDDNTNSKLFILNPQGFSMTEFKDAVDRRQELQSNQNNEKQYYSLPQVLYYNTSKLMTGDDVLHIQSLLTKLYSDCPTHGTFDEKTQEIVKRYQATHEGFDITGIVDDKLYNSLLYDAKEMDDKMYGTVINKGGANEYRLMDVASDIVNFVPYGQMVKIYEYTSSTASGFLQKWFKTDKGYIREEDIYCPYTLYQPTEYPTTKYLDSGYYVSLIQDALKEFDKKYVFPSPGEFDLYTQNAVKDFQTYYSLVPTGIVDSTTWNLLIGYTGIDKTYVDDNFKAVYNVVPEVYQTNFDSTLLADFLKNISMDLSCSKETNVIVSAIAYFGDKSKSKKISLKINPTLSISAYKFINLFLYDVRYGQYPDYVEWIVAPYGKQPFKWIIQNKK